MHNDSAPFQPISKDRLYLKISDAIYAHIKQSGLRPGDKLPSERDMAEMFQTGRHSVREALRVLENRGMIEVKTAKGAFVKDANVSSSTLQLKLTDYTFDELEELRVSIETQAIGNAIAKATDQEKQELLHIAQELSRMESDGVYSNTLDHKFHRKVMEMGHNRVYAHIIMAIREGSFLRYWEDKNLDQLIWLPTVPFHLELARAIAGGDLDAALKANGRNDQYVAQIAKLYRDRRD